MFFKFVVAFCLFSVIHAQVFSDGSCPEVEIVKDFDLKQFMGRWYEWSKYYVFFEMDAKCVTVNYTLHDNDTIHIVNEWTTISIGARSTIGLIGRVIDEKEPAKLKVKYPMMPADGGSNYWILATDYVNYAIVYTCKKITNSTSHKYAWILTREANPIEMVTFEAYEVATKNGLHQDKFELTDHTNCYED